MIVSRNFRDVGRLGDAFGEHQQAIRESPDVVTRFFPVVANLNSIPVEL